MADKARGWRLAGVVALATAASLVLMAPAGASPAVPRGGEPPSAAQVAARHGTIAAGQVALFKAATSAGATAITWTLSGPGVIGSHFSATCSASTSQMESSFSRAGVIHVVAQIRYASGAVKTATHKLVVRAAKVRHVAGKMARLATQWVLCLRGPADRAVRATNRGGPPRGCQDQYFDGPIDAIGCLSVLPSYNKIPAPERRLLCRVISCPKGKHVVVPALLPILSTRTVRLNGIDFRPEATAFVLDQNDGLMVSSKATASMLHGLLQLHSGRMRLAEYSRPLFKANLNQLLAKYPALAVALDLSGFKISGKLTVELAHDVSIVRASITLPGSFTGSGGHPVTSSVRLIASNEHGLLVETLLIAIPGVDFAGTFALDHLAFCYQLHISFEFCEKKTGANFGSFEGTSASSWNATARIDILGTQISAVPTPQDPQQGIGFVNGNFDFAGATVDFNPNIPLGDTGVSLSSLSASLALDPTRFQGSIGLTAGDFVSINGSLFLVFASPSQPYTFSGHEVGATGMPTPTVTTTAIAVGGTVGVVLPVIGNQTLASGYVLFYPGYLAVGGNASLNILNGTLVIAGGVNGQFSLDNATFNVEGTLSVTATIIGFSVGFSAQAVVSSIGIAACGTANLPIVGNVSAGVGYTWGGSVNTWVGSCDLSPYIVVVSVGPHHKIRGPVHLRVPAHLPSEMVQVRGHGGAPEITITGPGGIHASIGSGSTSYSKLFLISRDSKTDTTTIAILKPAAGTYSITANSGSPAITKVLAAQGRNGKSVVQRFHVHVRQPA